GLHARGRGLGLRDRRAGAAQLLQQPRRRDARHDRALRLAPRGPAGRVGQARRPRAARMILRRREARRARIEIVPMIDVVFFLLVFFMMASLSMAVYGGLPVNLPQAATGQGAAARSRSVTIDREGRAFLNREPVAVAELEGRVRPMLQGNPTLAIVINADGDAAHHHVVAVLDALRLAGVSRMAIAVAPLPETRR